MKTKALRLHLVVHIRDQRGSAGHTFLGPWRPADSLPYISAKTKEEMIEKMTRRVRFLTLESEVQPDGWVHVGQVWRWCLIRK